MPPLLRGRATCLGRTQLQPCQPFRASRVHVTAWAYLPAGPQQRQATQQQLTQQQQQQQQQQQEQQQARAATLAFSRTLSLQQREHMGHESHTFGDVQRDVTAPTLPPNAYGCFRVRGPALLESNGKCLQARLQCGGRVEIWDHAGAPTVHEATGDVCLSGFGPPTSSTEDVELPCCVLIAQHIELKGVFRVDSPPPGLPPSAAHVLQSGKVVLSVKQIPPGAVVTLSEDGELLHPVNLTPEDGDRDSWAHVDCYSHTSCVTLLSASDGSVTSQGSGGSSDEDLRAMRDLI